MIVSWLSNREIERSLNRARESESALKEQRDRLEIIVEERTKELQQAQAEKVTQLYRFAEFGRLASGLFHDLMNPLTSVSLYLEQLDKSRSGEKMTQAQDYLQKAIQASKRIQDFTQAMRKQLQHREAKELFSLNEGVRQAIQLLTHKAWEAHVTITFNANEELTTFANPLKFHQIILNMVSNGIDAYRDIPSSQDRKREVVISIHSLGDDVNIIVQDWGCGISPEITGKIFQPFFTTKTTGNGIGIGLSSTKEIIEKDFSGTVTVESSEGWGSTFRITFPRNNGASQAS
jgi:two-component system C4-dicarboxylate transport sensor histidine kinase DctB